MKYLKLLFSQEVSGLFIILIVNRFDFLSEGFFLLFLFLSGLQLNVIFLFRNFQLFFREESSKNIIINNSKLLEVKEHSLLYKIWSFSVFIIPLILNPILIIICFGDSKSFLNFNTLTISLVWCILLILETLFYFKLKKIKKEIKTS